MIASGRHDVAPYLTRVLFDTHALLLGCGQDEALAERFIRGDQKLAAEARKQFLSALRADGHSEDADWMEARFKSDYDASNVLSHVGGSQVGRLIEATKNGPRPVFGGHIDVLESSLLWRSVLDQEHWALIALLGGCGDCLDDDWRARFSGAQQRLVTLMRVHETEGGNKS